MANDEVLESVRKAVLGQIARIDSARCNSVREPCSNMRRNDVRFSNGNCAGAQAIKDAVQDAQAVEEIKGLVDRLVCHITYFAHCFEEGLEVIAK